MCHVASSLLRMLKTVETVMFQVTIYCNNNYIVIINCVMFFLSVKYLVESYILLMIFNSFKFVVFFSFQKYPSLLLNFAKFL